MGDPQPGIDERLRNVCARMMAASDGDLDPIVQEFLALARKKLNREPSETERPMLGDIEAA